MEQNTNRQAVLNDLIKSKHGDLQSYIAPGIVAAATDADFFFKLMVWNLAKGEIRDTKVALPIISLRTISKEDKDLAESAVACLLSLDPRNLVKAYRFSKEMKSPITGGHRRMLEKGLKLYLSSREENQGLWDRVALQHRHSLKELYAVSHYKPSDHAQAILFKKEYPARSVFADLAKLKTVSAEEAAGIILNRKIPFQIAMGALGRKKEEFIKFPELPLALMSAMSGQQLLSMTNMLKSLGVFTSPMLMSEYNKALDRAKKDKRVSTLKAAKASVAVREIMEEDKTSPALIEKITKKLSSVQEEKLAQKTIEGDWVVLGDCSSSMERAIDTAKEVASYITKSVKGKVYLIFFNTDPQVIDVTGKTLDEIRKQTSRIYARGMTSCGCGVKYLADRQINIDGIALVSDGGENTRPVFAEAYLNYEKLMDKSPTVYFYRTKGDQNMVTNNCNRAGIAIEEFDINESDHYSIPNLVGMMKTIRYSLIDEIMSTPLLTFADVFESSGKK